MLLTSLGEKFTEEEADSLIEDGGGGRSISYEKLVKNLNAAANKDTDDD
jgi:hypothetical protein